MATEKKTLVPMTNEQLEKIQNLLADMKARANAAYQANDLYMNAIYAELVKVVSPIVMRAMARKEREEKAAINKQVRSLRKGEAPVPSEKTSK